MKNVTYLRGLFLILALSLFAFTSYGQKFTGLTATASSGTAAAAVDNNMGTRWESAFSDPQWIVVDLGEEKTVGAIKLYWEGANAKDYTVSFSTNGSDFSGDLSYTGKAAGTRTDAINNLNVTCRYIKMLGTARNLTYGYSIWEFEVYPPVTPVLTSLTITPANTTVIAGNTKQLTVGGLDQLGNPIALTNATSWSVDGTGASIDASGLLSTTTIGFYTVTATNSSISKTTTVDVLPATTNLSYLTGVSATATASSGSPAAGAFDNNLGSRWESAHGEDPQWIMVDLLESKSISDIYISWEAANAKDYLIEGSINGTDWTTIVSKTGMAGGSRIDRINGLSSAARYVRLTGTARNLTYGYSIFELQIYGTTLLTTILSPGQPNALTIYANSATQRIVMSESVAAIALFTIAGKKVVEATEVSQLDIASVAKGIYLARLTDQSGKVRSAKLVIR